MNKEQIKELALASGFKLKEQEDGSLDLNEYVYEFANALLVDREQLIRDMHSQVSGYLQGNDWYHWKKFHQDRFKVE
jgi:hypothetical protein